MITVIVTRSAHAGASAWKTTGADLREYEGQAVNEQERETRIDAEVRAAREEYAEEDAEAAEAEIAEQNAALDVPLNLRITRGLDARLRRRAAAEQIPTSALVRRLLTQTVHDYRGGGLTEAEVEEIARRVVRKEVRGS